MEIIKEIRINLRKNTIIKENNFEGEFQHDGTHVGSR